MTSTEKCIAKWEAKLVKAEIAIFKYRGSWSIVQVEEAKLKLIKETLIDLKRLTKKS